MMRKPPAGFRSILGPHSDQDRPKLRAMVSAQTVDWLHRRETDPLTLFQRRARLTEIARKCRAAQVFHMKQRAADIAAGG